MHDAAEARGERGIQLPELEERPNVTLGSIGPFRVERSPYRAFLRNAYFALARQRDGSDAWAPSLRHFHFEILCKENSGLVTNVGLDDVAYLLANIAPTSPLNIPSVVLDNNTSSVFGGPRVVLALNYPALQPQLARQIRGAIVQGRHSARHRVAVRRAARPGAFRRGWDVGRRGFGSVAARGHNLAFGQPSPLRRGSS
eukprot:2764626-Pyramimonas_sp.AAC.1